MKIDKNTLDLSKNMLTKSYDKLTYIEPPNQDRYIHKTLFMFDISYYFDTLDRVLQASDFDDTEFEETDIIRITYNILNIAAHYRHYFYRKLKTHSVIIMYASNKNHYSRYAMTLNMLNKLSVLFKKTIFIESISDEGNIHRPYIYNHLAHYTLQMIIYLNNVIDNKTIIVWLGRSIIDYQYLNLQLENCYNITIKRISKGYDILFNGKFLPEQKPDNKIIKESSWEFREILPYLIALLGGKGGHPSRISEYIGKRKSKILQKTFDYISNNLTQLNAKTFSEEFFTEDSAKEMFQVRLQQLDIHRNNDLRITVKKLIKIWESKLDTESTYSLNDIFEFKDGTMLKVDWLMEY